MNKKIFKDIVIAVVTVAVLLGIAFGISAIVNSQVEKKCHKRKPQFFCGNTTRKR